MPNPFGSVEMAAAYATSRPSIHPRVLEIAFQTFDRQRPFQCALDVGCGAGISTRALARFAERRIGLDPVVAMLDWAVKAEPGADFVAGGAEAIPVRDAAIDLITAAGSLNYANLDLFFPEAARVLTRAGVLLVYDFSPGRSFRDTTAQDEWYAEFSCRYPAPAGEARPLSPEILSAINTGFRVQRARAFEIAVTLTPDFYLRYVLTETNVAAAVRSGVPPAEIRSWCAETLAPVWKGEEREVLFRGYFACLHAA